MTFIELLQKLEARLGYHQLPLNPAAVALKNLFETIPLHHDLMTRLVQVIYGANRCRKLSDPIEYAATLDAFAPLRLAVLQSKQTDIDLYRFTDELCLALDAAFGATANAAPAKEPPHKGEVVQMAPYRRRIKTWA